MSTDLLLLFADRVGVFVFAISGGLLAVRKDMDLFGVVVLAFLPAVGGGTLRDLILDVPVFWLEDVAALAFAVAGGLAAFFAHPVLDRITKPLRLLDAAGMALFATAGAAKTLALGLPIPIVLMMGAVTACAGGLLRDVVANEDPLLLKQDIYATAALLAAAVYAGLAITGITGLAAYAGAITAGFALRMISLRRGWSLPRSPFR